MPNIQLNIFNFELLEQVEQTSDLNEESISKAYKEIFSESALEEINIIFVDNEYIQELNRTYRDIDAPTDVLSFQITEDMKNGEIYISPEYVYTTYQGNEYEEEILRLIIHGTLHILGHDHTESLNDNPNEEMFLIQESLLKKFKSKCF